MARYLPKHPTASEFSFASSDFTFDKFSVGLSALDFLGSLWCSNTLLPSHSVICHAPSIIPRRTPRMLANPSSHLSINTRRHVLRLIAVCFNIWLLSVCISLLCVMPSGTYVTVSNLLMTYASNENILSTNTCYALAGQFLSQLSLRHTNRLDTIDLTYCSCGIGYGLCSR